MRQNESIVVVVTCRRRLGRASRRRGEGARARGAAASEFVRLVCPHEESANVDKEGCSSLAAARGAGCGRARARDCLSDLGSWLSSRRPRFRRAIESSKYWMHQRQRGAAARAAVWEQRRRCAPECRRASPTKPGVRRWRLRRGGGTRLERVAAARRGRRARARVARRRHVGKAQDQRPQWRRPRPDICTPGDLHPH